jgi:hypothetical protein
MERDEINKFQNEEASKKRSKEIFITDAYSLAMLYKRPL